MVRKIRSVPILMFMAATILSGCATTTAAEEDTPAPAQSKNTSAPLDGLTVAIDPGHNGGNANHPEIVNEPVDAVTKHKPCDTTGTETNDGYAEHAFNFEIGTLLQAELEDLGATVVTTRDSDDGVGPCLPERAATGNDANADAAISIHADGGPANGSGFHILEPEPIEGHTEEVAEPSHELALALRDEYESIMSPADYIGSDGIDSRDDMGGLNLSTVPKVMVECGNMRNTDDAKQLADSDFQTEIAHALAEGITDYLTESGA